MYRLSIDIDFPSHDLEGNFNTPSSDEVEAFIEALNDFILNNTPKAIEDLHFLGGIS